MKEERKRIYIVVGLVVAVGLVLSCLFGALAGGVAGFLTGQRQARLAERTLDSALEELQSPDEWQMPWWEDLPIPEESPEGIEPLPDLDKLPADLQGALIVQVVAGTPAEEAGLAAGDVILTVDSVPVDRNHRLPDLISQYRPGDQVTITYWRENEEESVQVSLGAHPEDRDQPYLGVFFQSLP